MMWAWAGQDFHGPVLDKKTPEEMEKITFAERYADADRGWDEKREWNEKGERYETTHYELRALRGYCTLARGGR